MLPSERSDRYDRVASAMHWLIGLALLGQIVFGFLLDGLAPRGTPARAGVINLHKSFGIVLGVLIVLRLLWRLRHHPPRFLATMPRWQQRAARLGHQALYACMLLMPMSGAVASNFSKHGIKFFGIALRPLGPDLPDVYAAFNLLHVYTAWIFSALIAGHVLMALKHALHDRDETLARMTTWRASSPVP
jgi:cytochrome b561